MPKSRDAEKQQDERRKDEEEDEEEDGEEEEGEEDAPIGEEKTPIILYYDARKGEQVLNVSDKKSLTSDDNEKYWFRIIELIPDPTCICDETGKIIISNLSFREKLDPGDTLRGKSIIESIIFQEDQERFMMTLNETVNSPDDRCTSTMGKLKSYINNGTGGKSDYKLVNFNWSVSRDNSIAYRSIGMDGMTTERCALMVTGKLTSAVNNTKAEVREAIELTSIEELKKANQEKERFIRRLVHELRTPLHLASSLMADATKADKESDKPMDSSVHIAEKQIMHLTGVVEDLALSMSEELGESIVPNMNEISIVELINSLLKSQCEEHVFKPFLLLCEYKDVPELIYTDRKLIGRIFHHLIENAFKYVVDRGTISIELSTSEIIEDGQKFTLLNISIKNDDFGALNVVGRAAIEDSLTRPNLVRMTSALDSTYTRFGHTREDEGLGIGLKITRQILDFMNSNLDTIVTSTDVSLRFTLKLNEQGVVSYKISNQSLAVRQRNQTTMKKISCKSKIDRLEIDIGSDSKLQSSSFPVGTKSESSGDVDERHLPPNTSIQTQNDSEDTQTPIQTPSTRPSQALQKILIVDDSKICRRIVKKILGNFGIDSLEASDGLQAKTVLQERSSEICCILMDLRMPNMNGIEATTMIRKELNLMIPIIILSAEMGSYVQSALERGANAAIRKPASVDDVKTTLLSVDVLDHNIKV